jgi:signal recognition particle subunit SRP19
MRGRGKIRIWPAYLDVKYSREEGRRVPTSLAVRDPTVDAIEKAADKIGLKPIVEPLTYPKHPWRGTGVVLVDKKGSKTEIIKKIASQIKGQ